MSRRWGVFTDSNGEERAQRHNVHSLEDCWIPVKYSRNRKGQEEKKGIRILSLNIRLRRTGALEAALRALQQGNVDIRVLQDTKLTRGIHMRYGAGYSVLVTHAEIIHWGGVAAVWMEKAGWQVEGIANYGPSVVTSVLTTGWRIWYVVGAYVTLNDAPTIAHVEEALIQASKGVDIILLRDLKVRLQEPR